MNVNLSTSSTLFNHTRRTLFHQNFAASVIEDRLLSIILLLFLLVVSNTSLPRTLPMRVLV